MSSVPSPKRKVDLYRSKTNVADRTGGNVNSRSFAYPSPKKSVKTSKGRILLVDDDAQICRVMRTAFKAEGYEIDETGSGEKALELIGSRKYDVVLLDINLPGKSGVDTCKEIRVTSGVPIIMVTVRDDAAAKIEALDSGAYDYVTKPFGMGEMLARVRSAVRRTISVEFSEPFLRFDNIEIDFEARRLTVSGERVRLTAKEFDLLRYFGSHANKTISHRELLQEVWGAEHVEKLKYLRVFVNRLRKKLEPLPHAPKYLLTEPFVGYRFEIPR
jgi:two-component system, OmpR family, KDP operon response regulator KdpE